uniref:Uncharacterized protein n=1 Tax=Serinus canaria TaxID=9135 RepID=A0A8C9MNI2_SERCA
SPAGFVCSQVPPVPRLPPSPGCWCLLPLSLVALAVPGQFPAVPWGWQGAANVTSLFSAGFLLCRAGGDPHRGQARTEMVLEKDSAAELLERGKAGEEHPWLGVGGGCRTPGAGQEPRAPGGPGGSR